MDIELTGKGIDVTPAIRSFTENKFRKLNRLLDSVMDVHVTLSVQKYLQIADITVKTRLGGFTSRGQTTDMYASINEAIDSLTKQARRQTQRIKSHKGRGWRSRPEALVAADSSTAEPRKKSPRVRREPVSIKPMSLEEAKLQLRGADNDFVLFLDSTTSEIKVIYKRKDGDLGLLEPKL